MSPPQDPIESTLSRTSSSEKANVDPKYANKEVPTKTFDSPDDGRNARKDQSHRKLEPRHVHLLAIGGTIGTAIFIGIGGGLTSGGPASLFIAYTFWSSVILAVNLTQAEMVVQLPLDSNFVRFAGRYMDDCFAIATGWNFFLCESALVCFELVAFGLAIQYWTTISTGANAGISMGMLVFYAALNLYNAKFFGEFEFWAAAGKLLLITGLLIMTFLLMVGANPQHDAFGFRYWNNPGSFKEFVTTGDTGRFAGFWAALINAGFTVAGPDYLSMTAGEAKHPRRVMPMAFRSVIYRLVAFFVLGAVAVGVLVPYDDDQLLNAIANEAAGGGQSPYVVGIHRLRIKGLDSVVNVGIMSSIFSAGNAFLYCASRTLYGLALHGQAPKIFTKTNRNGVPYYCVTLVLLIGLLSLMQLDQTANKVLNWFISLVTSAQLVNWLVMCCTWLCWNRAMKAQNVSRDTLHFKTRFQPYLAYYALISSFIVLLTNGWQVFVKGHWATDQFIFAYAMPVIFIVVAAGYKLIVRSKFKKPEEVDLIGEQADIDAYEAELDEDRERALAAINEHGGKSKIGAKFAKLGHILW